MRPGIPGLITGALLTCTASVHAQVVSYLIDGTVTSITNPDSVLPTTLASAPLGSSFTLDFTVDTSVGAGSGSSTVGTFLGAVTDAAETVNGTSVPGSFGGANTSVMIFANDPALVAGSYTTGYVMTAPPLGVSVDEGITLELGQFTPGPTGFYSSAFSIPSTILPLTLTNGMSQIYDLTVNHPGATQTSDYVTGAISSVAVATEGGSISDPTLLSQGDSGSIAGSIGGNGSEQFFSFSAASSTVDATASVFGASTLAQYEFQLLELGGSSILCTATLDQADSFTGALDCTGLTAGDTYEVGLVADSADDPNFSITFTTPASGVPEPATFSLVGLGLAGLGLIRRRRGWRRR